MNSLTKCRAHLTNTLATFSPVPVKYPQNPLVHPAPLYAEIRVDGPTTTPTIKHLFTVTVLVIALPATDTNIYQYLDTANQFHDYLEELALTIPDVGCLTQEGELRVSDFGYVDRAETIKQATVTCDVILEK